MNRDELRALQAPLKQRYRDALDSDASPEDRRKLLELTERYCVVYQTLRTSPAIAVREASAA